MFKLKCFVADSAMDESRIGETEEDDEMLGDQDEDTGHDDEDMEDSNGESFLCLGIFEIFRIVAGIFAQSDNMW